MGFFDALKSWVLLTYVHRGLVTFPFQGITKQNHTLLAVNVMEPEASLPSSDTTFPTLMLFLHQAFPRRCRRVHLPATSSASFTQTHGISQPRASDRILNAARDVTAREYDQARAIRVLLPLLYISGSYQSLGSKACGRRVVEFPQVANGCRLRAREAISLVDNRVCNDRVYNDAACTSSTSTCPSMTYSAKSLSVLSMSH